MTTAMLLPFLRGAVATACLVAGLLFLRLWRLSDERLLLFFSLGFAVFAVHWIGLGIVGPPAEAHHWLYLLRLLAFVLIIAGIVDKNRRSTRP